ncbi:MAG TPA: queuosine salvage family protein [Roseiflexaceae bacterium]|nr:queuosine salvage family protein [Roseiflexaceae bacterium]
MADVLQEIRVACRAVAARARFVRINEGRIPSYAASLPLERVAQPEHDPQAHYLGHGDETAAFFLTLDAVNFGSGYFPYLRKRPGMSGYFTVATALTEHFRAHGPIPPEHLAAIDAAACAAIFGQDPASPPAWELMGLFARAWRDLGRFLLEGFGGRFLGPIEAAGGSAAALVRLLARMPLFEDVADYHGLRVPFYKRAQITAADLWTAFGGRGPGRFEDMDRLTIFADNLVPHVLRLDGVLRYDEGLAARIDTGQPIDAGSPEEVELRACALHAVELMAESLRASGHAVWPMQLDYLLWNRGQQPAYKQAKPRHRARSVYY